MINISFSCFYYISSFFDNILIVRYNVDGCNFVLYSVLKGDI